MKSGVTLWVGTALAALLAAGGARAASVKRDYDESVRFQDLKTYAWRSEEPRTDSLMDGRIREAVDADLAAKGFAKVPPGEADFFADYRHGVEGRSGPGRVSTGVGVGVGTGGVSFGGLSLGIGLGRKNYAEEELAVELTDPKTSKLIWRGSVRQKPVESDDPAKTTKKVRAAVRSVLAKFPPKPKS